MRIVPTEKCKSYHSYARAVNESAEFFAKITSDTHGLYWAVVPVEPEKKDKAAQPIDRWTVVAFLTEKWTWAARSIADHGWKVVG